MLADALQERSDPRGELIALQCAPSRVGASRRERQLLTRYASTWLGPLAAITDVNSVVFERGFPVFVKYRNAQSYKKDEALRADDRARRARILRATLDATQWSTVRTLDVGSRENAGTVELLSSERIRQYVKAIVNVTIADLGAVIGSPSATPFGWRRLIVARGHGDSPKMMVDVLERCGAVMTNLKEIDLTFGRPEAGMNEAINKLICSNVAQKLDEIVMSYHDDPVPILYGGAFTYQSLAAGLGPKRLIMRSRAGSISIDNIEEDAPTIIDVQAWSKDGWSSVSDAFDEMCTWGRGAFPRGVLINAVTSSAEFGSDSKAMFEHQAGDSARRLGQVRIETDEAVSESE